VSWGTTGATMLLLARDVPADPLVVGWARLAVAAPALVVAAALTHRPSAACVAPSRADLGRCVVLGAAMAAYQICYFEAVSLTGVAVAALFAICSAPIFVAGLAGVVLRERLGSTGLAALALAVVGAALLSAGSLTGPRGFAASTAGTLLALGAGLSYAVYAVTAKGLLARMRPLTQAAITFTIGALLLSPMPLVRGGTAATLLDGWPLLLYLGLGPTAVAYALFTAGLRRVPATAAAVTSLLEPLTATLLGVVVFGETLGPASAAGALLLLAALVLISRR